MLEQNSAGVVLFFQEDKKIKYLLLHYRYKTEYWDFPRGAIEKGETPEQAAMRETMEETGITNIELIEGFRETVRWFYKQGKDSVSKHVTYFLANAKTAEVTLSQEHIGFQWLNYDDSLKTATFENSRNVLKKANQFLQNQK